MSYLVSRPKMMRTMCTKGISGELSINNLNQYPWSTSPSILDRHPDWYSINTWLKVNQGYRLRISIDMWLQMPLVHMIRCLSIQTINNAERQSFLSTVTESFIFLSTYDMLNYLIRWHFVCIHSMGFWYFRGSGLYYEWAFWWSCLCWHWHW